MLLASSPLFSLMQVPIHKGRDRGRSFVKHSTVYSGVKKKVSICLKGLMNVRGFLWRMWLRGLGSWVRTWGRGEGGVRLLGRGEESREEDLFWAGGEGCPRGG